MAWIRLPADLSTQATVRKVEQRFGLVGFARLVKLLELLAASPYRDACVIELPSSDWLEALQTGRSDLDAFLAYLAAANWLTVEPFEEPGAPLRVTLLQVGALLPSAVDPQLFTDAAQWVAWCVAELGMPSALAKDPNTQQLFRRWCASNVTVLEMQDAVQAAIAKQASLGPSALHDELMLIRRKRLDKARG